MKLFLQISLIFLWVLAASIVSGTVQAQTAPFRVYLTFEDGPTSAYTPEILDILAQYGAQATFFPNGNQIPGKEAIIQRIIREGHAIGNHMWEEPGYYAGADPQRVVEGYLQAEQVVRDALATTPDLLAIYDAQIRLFRQPGGAANSFPQGFGIDVITYNWHVDSNDCGWFLDPAVEMSLDEQAIENVLGIPRALGGERWNVYQHGDGAIITFHDINRVTGRVLPVILAELQQAGATFHKLPRPEDALNTMPVALGQLPANHAGIPGVILPAAVTTLANIRVAPDQGAALLMDSLPAGTAVMVTGRTPNWYRVRVADQEGWIAAHLLQVRGPIPSLPAVNF